MGQSLFLAVGLSPAIQTADVSGIWCDALSFAPLIKSIQISRKIPSASKSGWARSMAACEPAIITIAFDS